MSVDIATIIGDGLLSGATVAVALITRHNVRGVRRTVNRTHAKVIDLERRTVSDKRISEAVANYAQDNPGELGEAILEDALRRLLIAIVDDNYPEGTKTSERNPARSIRYRRDDFG